MDANPNLPSKQPSRAGGERKALQTPATFLIFYLGKTKFGVDARKVRELKSHDALTKVADGAQLIEDVVIWRNHVVPLVDMRIRFNFGTPQYETRTSVIMLEVGGRYIGMVVDSVAEVVRLAPDQVKPLPSADGAAAPSCLIGVASHDNANLILIDIEQLMGAAGVAASQQLS